MRKETLKCVITFDSTSQAMKMEKISKENSFEGRLIPLPTIISAGCGLSFCTPIENTEKAEDLMSSNHIEYNKIYQLLI